jgi:hypothetical protein
MNSTCNCSELKARVADSRRIEDQVVGPPFRGAPSDIKEFAGSVGWRSLRWSTTPGKRHVGNF